MAGAAAAAQATPAELHVTAKENLNLHKLTFWEVSGLQCTSVCACNGAVSVVW